MIGAGEFDEADRCGVARAKAEILAAQVERYDAVLVTVDEYARYGGRAARGTHGVIAVRGGIGRGLEEVGNGAAAQVEFPGFDQAGDGSECDDALERGVIGSQAQGKMSTRGMAGHHDALRVGGKAGGVIADAAESGGYVLEGSGPTAAWFANAAVLDIGGDETRRGECGADRAFVKEIEAIAPEAAMDHHHDGMRTGAGRNAEIDELAGRGSVGDAPIGAGSAEVQNLAAHRETERAGYCPLAR